MIQTMKSLHARRRLLTCLALTAAALAATAATASAIPTGTFKIRSEHGTCLQADTTISDGRMYSAPCSTLNLDQQWVYNAVTQQLASVGKLGLCAEVDNNAVALETCTTTEPDQRWYSYASGSGEVIRSRWSGKSMEVDAGVNNLVYTFTIVGAPGPNHLFHFDLI